MHIERLFDFAAHRIGPRLGPENPHIQRRLARINALSAELIQNGQHIGRGHHDDLRFEILNQRDLPFGHAPRHRDHGTAQTLRPIVRTQTASEQTIAVRDMANVPRPPARGTDRPRDAIGPIADVVLRISDHRRLTCGAGRRMYPRDLILRHREHAKGISVAQILLHREGKLRKIGQRLEVVRMHTVFVKVRLEERRIVIGMA